MLGRIIVIGLIGSATLSVVALAVLILLRTPQAVQRSGSFDAAISSDLVRVPFSGQTGTWMVSAVALADQNGGIEVNLWVVDAAGQPAPEDLRLGGLLIMIGHPMPPETMLVERLTPGSYRARGRAVMAGSWRLQLMLPDGNVEARLRVAER